MNDPLRTLGLVLAIVLGVVWWIAIATHSESPEEKVRTRCFIDYTKC